MKLKLFLLLLITSFAISCSPSPQPIDFGKDECSLCKMTISQRQWGAEILTKKSRTIKFDAIECMAKYINDGKIKPDDIQSYWIVEYDIPGEITNAQKVFYLYSRSLPSPMGMFLTGFSSRESLEKTMKEHQGETLNWDGVLKLVKEEWGD